MYPISLNQQRDVNAIMNPKPSITEDIARDAGELKHAGVRQ
jgi:hypothetical protein